MSAYNRPVNFVPIYNELNYNYADESLSLNTADQRYLRLTGGILGGLLTTNAGISSSEQVNISNTTNSTNRVSGALVVAGGLGVDLDTHMSNLHLNNSSSELKVSGANGHILVSTSLIFRPLYLPKKSKTGLVWDLYDGEGYYTITPLDQY
jgi:hypothetical protein